MSFQANTKNILIYCQHVVGIGHLCRMLEIIRALHDHRVTLILGGPPVNIALPKHVEIIQLPGLMMDAKYTRMFPVDPGQSLEEVKHRRRKILLELAKNLQPDVLLIELYPFGRGGFHFELEPFLRAVRTGSHHCPIVCSLRDILVEKKNQQKFEQQVLDRLNSLFDALLVHGDPNVIRLDATFSRVADIRIPVTYTGYICQRPKQGDRERIRKQLNLQPEERLITVSAGGGSFGYAILEASVKAHAVLQSSDCRMQVFTGPYLDEKKYGVLRRLTAPGAVVERFSDNFPAQLAASDLSISMGGYNTTMNVIAADTPALIFPYGHDREQGLRTEKLARLANLAVLAQNDLEPARLARKITGMMGRKNSVSAIQLNGAEQTAAVLTDMRLQEYASSASFRSTTP
jgi:predicted glycosyltransferase